MGVKFTVANQVSQTRFLRKFHGNRVCESQFLQQNLAKNEDQQRQTETHETNEDNKAERLNKNPKHEEKKQRKRNPETHEDKKQRDLGLLFLLKIRGRTQVFHSQV